MPCPSCGAFSFMRLPDFDIDYEEYEAGGKKQYKIKKCSGAAQTARKSTLSAP